MTTAVIQLAIIAGFTVMVMLVITWTWRVTSTGSVPAVDPQVQIEGG